MSLHTYPNMLQRSPEWYAARCGIVTASVVGNLISVGAPDALSIECPSCKASATEPCVSAARKTPTPIKTPHTERMAAASSLPPVYRVASNEASRGLTASLVAERITGEVEETWPTIDMQRGIDHEPIARARYAEVNGVEVTEVGFMVSALTGGQRLGFSPDGLVGDDGLIEVKCPKAKNHIQTILDDIVPAHHMAQLQAGLLVSGRAWVDFISFCAGLPLWTKRVTPDPKWRQVITEAVVAFEHTAEQTVSTYLERAAALPATDPIIDITDWNFAS